MVTTDQFSTDMRRLGATAATRGMPFAALPLPHRTAHATQLASIRKNQNAEAIWQPTRQMASFFQPTPNAQTESREIGNIRHPNPIAKWLRLFRIQNLCSSVFICGQFAFPNA